MKNRDKPHLVGVPGGRQAVSTASGMQAGEQLWKDVVECLDGWCQWAPSTERGVLTPTQFLAVILWVLQTSETTEADEKLIVERWGRALLAACSRGIVRALHPASLLPLEVADGPGVWVLSVADAAAFLDSNPVGFDISKALDWWRGQAQQQAIGGKTLEQVALRRQSVKGTRWTEDDRCVVSDAVNQRSLAAVAKVLGLREYAVRNVIKCVASSGSELAHNGPDRNTWTRGLLR